MRTVLFFTVFIGVCVCLFVCGASRLISEDEIQSLFTKAFKNELSESERNTLHDVIEVLRRPEHVSQRSLESSSSVRLTFDCIICRSAFTALFRTVKEGGSDDSLSNVISILCTALGIENERVCHGAVSLNMPILVYIIQNSPEATPNAFCGLVLQTATDKNVCPFHDPRFEWTIDLPPVPENVPEPQTSDDPLTIAVLTDAHLDPLYEAFGVANCDEPVCCRKGQTPAVSYTFRDNLDESVLEESLLNIDGKVVLDLDSVQTIKDLRRLSQNRFSPRSSAPAGYWGDYRDCDTPIWAFDDLIDTISENHKNVDVVYYIGDSIDHGVWETTYNSINGLNNYVVDKIRRNFGDLTLVVPTIGNHESQPTNQFAPSSIKQENLNTTWLYKALADKWDHYLTEEAQTTLLDRGDFSRLVRPGLRAISLNNNVAYKYNWWLVYDPLDAKKHLDWLVSELAAAESHGERVHILTHIPPGVHDLTHTWTREYNRIVNRFSKTIAAEFNGHTHSDEFKIFYDEAGEPINVAWGGGSASSYTNYNLNYKIATFDSRTYLPLNIVNYVYNLTEANLTPNRRPHWFQLYDMRNSFGLTDLSATSMDQAVHKMATTDRHLLDLYSAFYSKVSDNRMAWCNTECKLDNLCKTVVTVLWERQKCEELRRLYEINNN